MRDDDLSSLVFPSPEGRVWLEERKWHLPTHQARAAISTI